jgi:hypothetical protein
MGQGTVEDGRLWSELELLSLGEKLESKLLSRMPKVCVHQMRWEEEPGWWVAVVHKL